MAGKHEKLRRLVCEHDLRPRARRRSLTTTDDDHGNAILPTLTRVVAPDGSDLRVADPTDVVVTGRFAYVAILSEAWVRRAAG